MAYRRRNFLVNKPFQFRFSLYVCSWLIALSFVYPLIIHNLFELFFRYLAHDPSGPPIESLLSTRKEVLTLLIILQLILLLITFLISVFMSHRIAGPLYKLWQVLMKVKDGDFSESAHFRKSDHFKDLADSFNEMSAAMKTRLQLNAEAVSSALKYVESGEDKAKALAVLKTAQNINDTLKF